MNRNQIEQQLSEVASLQKSIRAVILDDSLNQLEEMMDEKRSRLAGIVSEELGADDSNWLSDQLGNVLEEEAELGRLVSDRLMLLKNQLRKTSLAGRALKGYVNSTDRKRGPGNASRDLKV